VGIINVANQTWSSQESGTSVWLKSVSFVDSLTGFVVGDSGTILKTNTGGGFTTTVERRDSNAGLLPQFKLIGNYPNPFNPKTTIVFRVHDSKTSGLHLILKIFNLNGQLIRTLFNGTIGPGLHSVIWDATNQADEPVPSGLYIYQMKAKGFIQAGRMLLLK